MPCDFILSRLTSSYVILRVTVHVYTCTVCTVLLCTLSPTCTASCFDVHRVVFAILAWKTRQTSFYLFVFQLIHMFLLDAYVILHHLTSSYVILRHLTSLGRVNFLVFFKLLLFLKGVVFNFKNFERRTKRIHLFWNWRWGTYMNLAPKGVIWKVINM